jgi:hypothetical protein
MAVAEDVGGDRDVVPDAGLGRIAPAVDGRLRALDQDARGRLAALGNGHPPSLIHFDRRSRTIV